MLIPAVPAHPARAEERLAGASGGLSPALPSASRHPSPAACASCQSQSPLLRGGCTSALLLGEKAGPLPVELVRRQGGLSCVREQLVGHALGLPAEGRRTEVAALVAGHTGARHWPCWPAIPSPGTGRPRTRTSLCRPRTRGCHMELLGRAVLPSAHPTDDPVRQGLSKSPEATQPPLGAGVPPTGHAA